MSIRAVHLSKAAQKDLQKVPKHILRKLMTWVNAVEIEGLEDVRKMPGYHDEPLKGPRAGQRSIRLSLSYRAVYTIKKQASGEMVSVEEVSKHDY